MVAIGANYDVFLQDDLGSSLELAGTNGTAREHYGFDEFGNNVIDARNIEV